MKSAFANGEPSTVSVAAPIETSPLKTLASPCQFVPITGVIVYFQDPNGTSSS